MWTLGTGGLGVGPQVRGLLDTEPLYRYLGQIVEPDDVGTNIENGRLRALALSTTSYSTGRTTTFVQAKPGIESWQRVGRRAVHTRIGLDHVTASAALPLVFPAIPIGEDHYGDGSIRQALPLAPAIHLGADRLLTVSVRYSRSDAEIAERQIEGYPPPAQVLGMLMHGVFLDGLENDVERLRRINRTLELIPPGANNGDALRPIDALVLRSSKDIGKLAVGLLGSLPSPLRMIARGLGASRTTTLDFLSYLLFERPYIERLLDLGYEDASRQWDRIARFLEY